MAASSWATAWISSYAKVRPMVAPSCATTFTAARRSRRAISASWRVAGIASGGQPGQESLQRFLALSRWRQSEGCIGGRQREREQRRQQRHGLGQRQTRCGQRRFQYTQLLGWRHIVVPPKQAV